MAFLLFLNILNERNANFEIEEEKTVRELYQSLEKIVILSSHAFCIYFHLTLSFHFLFDKIVLYDCQMKYLTWYGE